MNKWSKLIKENRDTIIDKMVEAYTDAEGIPSGWHTSVEMDRDGNVWVNGIMSQGSQSRSSWAGKTHVVKNISSWEVEVPSFVIEDDEAVQQQRDEYYRLEEEAEKNDEEFEYDSFYSYLADRYPDLLREVEETNNKAEREYQIDCYRDNASDELDYIIKDEESHEGEMFYDDEK